MNYDKLYKTINIIFLTSGFLFLSLILMSDSEIYIKIISTLFVSLNIFIEFVFVKILRKNVIEIYIMFNKYIDNIVNDEENIVFDSEDDNLISKFQYKLKSLYENINEDRARIKKEKDNIQTIVSDISHQVKTPIANLKLYNSTIIERNISGKKLKELLMAMDVQINKLDFLMQSMIKISRLESGMINLNIKIGSIFDTIAQALGNIILNAEKKNIKVSVFCDEKIKAKHDFKWTSEAIFNILDNAVKYSNYGGNIKVNVEELEMFVRIDVIDNGKGIKKENYRKIFERFYREDSVSKIPGTGLGLYLSKEIITREDGYIKVKSESGRETVFSIFLLKV